MITRGTNLRVMEILYYSISTSTENHLVQIISIFPKNILVKILRLTVPH